MSELLDFANLRDDQLIQLIRHACREAVNRGTAVEAAARRSMLDEAARGQVAAEATKREAERIATMEAQRVSDEAAMRLRRQAEAEREAEQDAKLRALWVRKADIAKRVRRVLAEAGHESKFDHGCQVNVWRKNRDGTGEKRVYLDFGKASKICLFASGNNRTAPGTMTCEGADYEPIFEAIRPVLQAAAEMWGSLKLNCMDPNLSRYEEVQP